MILAPSDIVFIASYLYAVLPLSPAGAHPCCSAGRGNSRRSRCPLDYLYAACLARGLLQPLRLGGSRALLLPGQAALLLAVHLSRGGVARHDTCGSNVASLDGDALVAGERSGNSRSLDRVRTARSGAPLRELGARIVSATRRLGMRGLLQVDKLARSQGGSLGDWTGALIVDVGSRNRAATEELLLELVADHGRNGHGARLRHR